MPILLILPRHLVHDRRVDSPDGVDDDPDDPGELGT